jgi:hypothetical protein
MQNTALLKIWETVEPYDGGSSNNINYRGFELTGNGYVGDRLRNIHRKWSNCKADTEQQSV